MCVRSIINFFKTKYKYTIPSTALRGRTLTAVVHFFYTIYLYTSHVIVASMISYIRDRKVDCDATVYFPIVDKKSRFSKKSYCDTMNSHTRQICDGVCRVCSSRGGGEWSWHRTRKSISAGGSHRTTTSHGWKSCRPRTCSAVLRALRLGSCPRYFPRCRCRAWSASPISCSHRRGPCRA